MFRRYVAICICIQSLFYKTDYPTGKQHRYLLSYVFNACNVLCVVELLPSKHKYKFLKLLAYVVSLLSRRLLCNEVAQELFVYQFLIIHVHILLSHALAITIT